MGVDGDAVPWPPAENHSLSRSTGTADAFAVNFPPLQPRWQHLITEPMLDGPHKNDLFDSNAAGTLRVGCAKSMESAPLLGRTCGAILFRAEVREVIRAEGPAVHPAKGEALVYRSHRVLYSAVSCGVRPNGPSFA